MALAKKKPAAKKAAAKKVVAKKAAPAKKTAAAKLKDKVKAAETFLATTNAADLAERLKAGPVEIVGVPLLDLLQRDLAVLHDCHGGVCGLLAV